MNKLAFSKPSQGEEEARLLFTRFRGVGYDGLQLKAGQYLPYLGDPGRFIGNWGGFQGSASALIWWGKLDGDGTAALRRVFTFAEAVGSEIIVFCHDAAREELTDDDIRRFARRVSELCKEARDRGLRLSLHNHYGQPVMHRRDFDLFFGAVEDAAVGLTIDTAHLAKSGVEDIGEVIRAFPAVIDNFHLKDFADGGFKVLGTGRIDFEPVFESIREIGYSGWVSADEESGADMLQAMEQCYRFMRAGLAAHDR